LESLYYTTRLRFNTAFRRRSKPPIKASLGANDVETWYHDPQTIRSIAGKYYKIRNVQAIGISIPPSYLQKTFLSNKVILHTLNNLENGLNKYTFLAALADHYLIDLELRLGYC